MEVAEQIDVEQIRAAEPADLHAYIDGVVDGSVISCRFVKLAVQRYLSDLAVGANRGIWFDVDVANTWLDFFPAVLKHSKGKWAGKPFELLTWEKFVIWNLFGFKREDGTRRFRTSYIRIAKKNGKTTLAAGIGLGLMVVDGEAGAEIYSAATKMEQAKLSWDEAKKMVRKSPDLQKYVTEYANELIMPSTESKFVPLGADAKTLDGPNPHGILIDELHAHKSSDVWDILTQGTDAREQPLLFAVTTSGYNINGIAHDQDVYLINILEGIYEDDSYFGVIYTLDEGDDWQDEKNWYKANPGLGVCIKLDSMREKFRKAVRSIGEQNAFLCKRMNLWTTQQKKFIDMNAWAKCGGVIDIDTLIGKPCLNAVDMSTCKDITADLKLFDLPDGKTFIHTRFYCPKDTAIKRSNEDKVPYLKWAAEGWITLTDGNVIDHEFIRGQIRKDHQTYNVEAMAFDPWNFESDRQELIKPTDGSQPLDESKIIEFKQTIANMSAPTKEVESNILSGKYVHNNNPVLTWMMNNVAVYTDPNENIRPVKNKSFERIDGVVALIMATGLRLKKPTEVDRDENLREVGI